MNRQELVAVHDTLVAMQARQDETLRRIEEFMARLDLIEDAVTRPGVPEAKRGPGRPRKDAGADAAQAPLAWREDDTLLPPDTENAQVQGDDAA
jgi:hypothetical protein